MSKLKLSVFQHTWINDCHGNGLRQSTIEVYRQRLDRVTSHFPDDSLSNLTPQNILAVFSDARQANTSPNTIHGWYRTLRTFSRWLFDNEYTEYDMLAKLKPPRTDKVIKRPIPLDDVKHIIELCQNSNEILDIRDHALMLTALDTGARLAELASMTVANITDDGAITLSNTKSRRDRTVYITPATHKAVRLYLRKAKIADGAIWCNERGEPLTKHGIQQVFKRRGLALGLKCGPHRWRRTAATGWVEGGADVESVRILLGHSSLNTTQMYLGLDEKAVQATFAKSTITNRLGKHVR
ncbi:MAG: tyrosine-type recombinase/integrase [Armatimonadota bacterium]